ncbi:MAG TPA: hypothetical protein VFF19_15810 [Reyranella sp.]|nr:hypothetical protein [Reyranella sp.]
MRSVGTAFLHRVVPAPILVLASVLAAAASIAMAAIATGLAQLLLGYGIVLGTSGGVAYSQLQQGANMLVPAYVAASIGCRLHSGSRLNLGQAGVPPLFTVYELSGMSIIRVGGR